jgi:hypothetical protein
VILPTILQSFNFDAETLSEQIGTGGAGGELDLGSALMTHTRRKQKIEQRIARRVKQQQQQQRQQQQRQQQQQQPEEEAAVRVSVSLPIIGHRHSHHMDAAADSGKPAVARLSHAVPVSSQKAQQQQQQPSLMRLSPSKRRSKPILAEKLLSTDAT